MEYKVLIRPSAQKDLDPLPRAEVEKIARRIKQLQTDPRPVGIQKLTNQEGYRIRSGNYRILFVISDAVREVLIYRIKHRREVYR